MKFKEFLVGNESGGFIVNPSWLEYLLNLFYQGYIGEVADEIDDTIMNNIRTIKNLAYGIIGREFDKKHLSEEMKTSSKETCENSGGEE